MKIDVFNTDKKIPNNLCRPTVGISGQERKQIDYTIKKGPQNFVYVEVEE